MKFCKDCRWVQLHTFPDDVPECRRRITTVDVVTGVESPVYIAVWERSCYESRKKSCGPEAKYFEPVTSDQQSPAP